ncbi:MAG TPA: PPC domain-containing protein [Tepidisphaeraceae bacterium]|jgi:hypothetical protein
MTKRVSNPIACGVLLLLSFALSARAASPQLSRILPRGAQRGSELELTFEGQRLGDAQEIFVYEPGVTIGKLVQPTDKKVAGKQVKATAKVDPEARIGEYHMRLRTASGISELQTFWVGRLKVIEEKEPNSDFKTPQPIPLNVTVAGVIENEDQDYFVFEAKKGQRVTAEIEGMRLGGAPLDPYLAILDENRFELTANDDSALLRQDSIVSIVAPKDGKYILQLRDSAFGGSGNAHYRLHVGTFPRPRVVYPLGGQVGQAVKVKFLGDVSGPIEQTITLPDKPNDNLELYASQDGQMSPSPNHFRVSEFPSVNEVEPNDTAKTATTYEGPLPVAFNGIISKTGGPGVSQNPAAGDDEKLQDNDYFKFRAKKGQQLEINVYARRLRSPLDSVLSLYDDKGRSIANNDDSGGPDSYLKFNVPADGDYVIRVRDHLKGAGDQYAYRVEITPAKAAVTLSIPQYTQQYSQERQTVTVHKGNRYATLVRVQRQDVAGNSPLTFSCPDLPAGVKMDAENVDAGVDVPVLFEASDDAKVGGKLVNLTAKPAAPAEVETGFNQAVELVTNGNQQSFYVTHVDRMAFSVGEEAPFSIKLVEPKVPLVQGGQMNLKVIAQRKKEFTGAINVRLLFKPPGIEAAANIEIPGGKDEANYPINASDGASARKWKLIVVASADSDGQTWVASPFAAVDVVAPFVTGKIATATVEQGKSVNVSAELDVKTKWEGKAKVELVGLPGNSSAPEREITADDKKIEFPVKTGTNTPAAQHKGLFLRVTVMKDGEPIVHNIARGGLLRVDGPLVAKNEKAKDKDKAASTPKKPAK